jgi:hypothetical protein
MFGHDYSRMHSVWLGGLGEVKMMFLLRLGCRYLRVHMVSEVEEAERLFCIYTMARARCTCALGTRMQYLQADSI